MYEAADYIIVEIEKLALKLRLDEKIAFWDMVEDIIDEKNFEGREKIHAYIKLKKTSLNR